MTSMMIASLLMTNIVTNLSIAIWMWFYLYLLFVQHRTVLIWSLSLRLWLATVRHPQYNQSSTDTSLNALFCRCLVVASKQLFERALLYKRHRMVNDYRSYCCTATLKLSKNLQVHAYLSVAGGVLIWTKNIKNFDTKIFFKEFQWRFSIETLLLACDNPFTQIWKLKCSLDNTCST